MLKEDVKQVMFKHNTRCCRDALNAPIYYNKVYYKLKEDKTRNIILYRELTKNYCDNEDVHHFYPYSNYHLI